MNKQKYFIYTGNAYPHKNLGRLIDATTSLKVKLKIVSGRNIFISRLEKIIKNKKAQNYVDILGFVNDKYLEKLYKNSIAFVFPTLTEGFGLPPMEAINAGTLAVVSDIPVLKEVYAESVFYFDPLNVNSIKVALENVLKMNDNERKLIIEKSQEFLKRYSWLKMAKETLKIYESVV
ncbi:MAG: Glycosyltransferase [Candidatus Woesebacteria bacterium GW2011_GWA1_33_30]|uniref:Glycosyltransferase n=1 Tax=Candidatus Woesebacteria bacterium GW2011_GWA2_33_28 TaxID=1618561 RepID=A0A0G0AAN1_9BACT|nr:MAG: Glycosyltransferase [Candidatus Woesebacteria bacterium GW2011_GWA2_33_28]KKP49128.1 MAG: Glycosyltransferase [Candidatus Woesebacteria bacterium GW2011_GWA1_33_30]KKP50272.1 MAG: Glycosyltransferase [Microgenomates group bacterium GW2011_GWC1_33_32]KKP52719.1 MAG: Glycosyltransferase [Candidatus Woesebacteria bacterium GW2011_GWB1_33_38]